MCFAVKYVVLEMYFSDNTVKKWYFQCVMCYPRLFILGQAALAIKHTSSENCLMKDQHKSLTLNRREQLMIALALLGNGAILFKTDNSSLFCMDCKGSPTLCTQTLN